MRRSSLVSLDTSAGPDQLIEHWGHHPCKLDTKLPLDAESAFATTLRCADRERANEGVFHRVWVDNEFVFDPRHIKFLCQKEDRTLIGFAERARSLVASGIFGINHLKIQASGWEIWNAITRLLCPVFAASGIPYGGSEASLMVGADQPLLPALHTWSKWEPTRPSGHLVQCVSGRIRLELDQCRETLVEGELIYLPAQDRPEIALEGIAAAIVINFRSGSARERADAMVRELALRQEFAAAASMSDIRSRHPDQLPHRPVRSSERQAHAPPALQSAAAELLGNSTGPRFLDQVIGGWMCFETGLGFSVGPPVDRDRHLNKRMLVRAAPTLRWTIVRDRAVIAANGRAVRAPAQPNIVALLEELVTTTNTVESLVERFSELDEDGPGPEDFFAMLQALFEFHGIDDEPV